MGAIRPSSDSSAVRASCMPGRRLRDAFLVPRHLEAELRHTTHLGRRRAASRTCRSSRLINQRIDRVPLCVSHAGMAFAADREAVPQCVQLGDRF
jgi:hypothetical protein